LDLLGAKIEKTNLKTVAKLLLVYREEQLIYWI